MVLKFRKLAEGQTGGLQLTRISVSLATCANGCTTANVLPTNKVDAQCDKLAT